MELCDRFWALDAWQVASSKAFGHPICSLAPDYIVSNRARNRRFIVFETSRQVFVFFVFLVASVTTIGCSSGEVLSPIDQFGLDAAKVKCRHAVDCHYGETEAECLASTRVNVARRKAWVEDGTLEFHPEKIDACLAALDLFYSCSQTVWSELNVEAVLDTCDLVFQGTVAEGGTCFGHSQCGQGACVKDPACVAECCAGQCGAPPPAPAPPPKIGEPCDGGACEVGAYCESNTCVAQHVPGHACSGNNECKPPAVCDYNFAMDTAICRIPVPRGGTCDPEYSLSCDLTYDICSFATKTCVRSKPIGQECSVDGECSPYGYCANTHTCAKRLPKGAKCDEFEANCLGDLQCINGVCDFVAATICK